MTEKIDFYYNHGLVAQTFLAERNILIWQHIGEEVSFLKSQPKPIQSLYLFIQSAAQTNFILSLAKIFDTPNKKYPVMCILTFLELLEDPNLESIDIIETTNTIELLKEFNCPISLIQTVECGNPKLFPQGLAKHYKSKYYESIIQTDISDIRIMRDKSIAHNEFTGELTLKFDTAYRLISFVSEIISIFGMAYHSTIWKTEKFSMIKKNAENEAYFIKSNINFLKERNKT